MPTVMVQSMTARRNAVVIGGASGIGWATARALAADGCDVTIADINGEAARDRARELGEQHFAAVVDVTNESSVEQLFGAVMNRAQRLDIVVNCAGISGLALVTEMAVELFRSILDVSVLGSFIVAKHAGRYLVEGGVLVLLSSLNARQSAVGMSAYGAAKAGVSMLTQTTALEWAPRGIRVNAVAPGMVLTPLTDPAMAIAGVLDDFVANTPLGRAGVPEDVADAVVFICSPQASWLTGEVLDLNGGAHLLRYPDVYGHVARAVNA